MKFTCEKTQLVSAISVASRTVAQKSAISGLEGILVRAGVKVMLTGYNLETGITVSVDADVQENGACIMPARLFFDIVRKLPDDTVSIQIDENFKVSDQGLAFRRSPSLPFLPTTTPSFRMSTRRKASACRSAS